MAYGESTVTHENIVWDSLLLTLVTSTQEGANLPAIPLEWTATLGSPEEDPSPRAEQASMQVFCANNSSRRNLLFSAMPPSSRCCFRPTWSLIIF